VPERLGYASTPTYHRRRNARTHGWATLAFIALFGTSLFFLFESVGTLVSGSGWVRWIVFPLLVFVCAVNGGMAAAQIIRGGHWGTRVEGGQLYLTQPGQPTRVIPVQDISHFVTLDVTRRSGREAEETTRSYELRLGDGGDRVRLHDQTFGWLPTFRRALLRENPRIQVVREVQDDDRVPAGTGLRGRPAKSPRKRKPPQVS
jgi:hypothetical protein